MKLASKEERKKSWGIRFEEDKERGFLEIIAVDRETGFLICYIQTFKKNGLVVRVSLAEDALRDSGYDPFEHGNTFDTNGAIVIK